MMIIHFFIATYILVNCNAEQFDVLKISNVSFPRTPWGTGDGKNTGIAAVNATYKKSIHDYTVCYRFLVDSYNDGLFVTIGAYTSSEKVGKVRGVLDRLGGMGTGFESEGLQGALFVNTRNVTGGGIGGKNFPWYHAYVFPKDIDISKWYQLCFSYSNKLNFLHLYIDGLKGFSFTYQDESQPLPANAFEHIFLGYNMRGSLTDLHIYDEYYDEARMISRTRTCETEAGQIFAWDTAKIKILQVLYIFNSFMIS